MRTHTSSGVQDPFRKEMAAKASDRNEKDTDDGENGFKVNNMFLRVWIGEEGEVSCQGSKLLRCALIPVIKRELAVDMS